MPIAPRPIAETRRPSPSGTTGSLPSCGTPVVVPAVVVPAVVVPAVVVPAVDVPAVPLEDGEALRLGALATAEVRHDAHVGDRHAGLAEHDEAGEPREVVL